MARGSRPFRIFADMLLRFLFRLLLRVHIHGIENVPRSGGFIAMLNHTNFLDPILLGGLTPRVIIMMSKIENFRTPLLGTIVRLYGATSVRRGELDLSAVRNALDVLQKGDGLMIAPEGTRTGTGELTQAHGGVALIGQKAGVAVLPVAIFGHEHFAHNLVRLRRTPVEIVYGQPFCFQPDATMKRRQQLDLMTQEAMYRLAALLPSQYRGVYADLTEATTRVTRDCRP